MSTTFRTKTNWLGSIGKESKGIVVVKLDLESDLAGMRPTAGPVVFDDTVEVEFEADSFVLTGELGIPENTPGIVLFAHGSGSSRFSRRNRYVASLIRQAGIGTLLFDLLSTQEEEIDNYTREFRFDIGLLSRRLIAGTNWVKEQPQTRHLRPGFFGSSTGAAAALVAAAELGETVGAIVSRGGRPDLAGETLSRVKAPTLLLVGGLDEQVIKLNRAAYNKLQCVKQLVTIPGASHLFEEPGKLNDVAELATRWFVEHLRPQGDRDGVRR